MSLFRSSRKAAAAAPVSEEAAARQTCEQITFQVNALDRAGGGRERRKHCAKLAGMLNDVEGATATGAVVSALGRANAASRLLTMLDEAADEGDSDDDSDDSANQPDPDLELAQSLLSCIASYAFLGGVRALQLAGGIMQLLKLMDHPEPTIRAYATAALQNATSFLEELDVERLTSDELDELRRLTESADASIREPAMRIRTNLDQDRRFQAGELDLAEIAEELDADGGLDDATGGGLRAAAGEHWWCAGCTRASVGLGRRAER